MDVRSRGRCGVPCRSMLVSLWIIASPTAYGEHFLEGRVTDEKGRPVEGATVHIADCIGTCFGGVARITDGDGEYVFETKPYRNFPHLTVSMPGRYHKSTHQSGPKLHEVSLDVPRRADFVLGTPAAATIRIEGDVAEGWKRTVLLRASGGSSLHRYDLTGHFTRGWGSWQFEQIPRSEPHHVVVIDQPDFEASDDRKVMRERQRESERQSIKLISHPISFVDPQRFSVQLEISTDDEIDSSYLEVVSVHDATYAERTTELAKPDPRFGPPADEEDQEKASELLERVARAAAPWNARPRRSISYQYDAIHSDDAVTSVKVDGDSPSGPAWQDISRLRGFAWMPPLRWLFSQPENVVFYLVEMTDERAKLVYRLRSPRGFSVGLGVGPRWDGFVSRRFASGSIQIDPRTDTVLQHRFSASATDQESIETYSDYVPVGTGYAPKTLRIESPPFDFRCKFRVHDGKLWLLEEATRGDAENPALRMTNVVVTEQ